MTLEEALALFKDHKYMTDFSWQDEMSEVAIEAIEAIKTIEKYRWHDLRKNPKDLPNNDINKLIVAQSVVFDKETPRQLVVAHYGEYVKGKFSVKNKGINEFEEGEVIAWKEVEPFEEE